MIFKKTTVTYFNWLLVTCCLYVKTKAISYKPLINMLQLTKYLNVVNLNCHNELKSVSL